MPPKRRTIGSNAAQKRKQIDSEQSIHSDQEEAVDMVYDRANFRNHQDSLRFSNGQLFAGPSQTRGKPFAARRVLYGRQTDDGFLIGMGFPFLDYFEEWKWDKFLSLNRPYYQFLCKVFYFNMISQKHDVDYKFSTYVRHKDFEVNPGKLTRIIGRTVGTGTFVEEKEFNLIEASRVIFQDDSLVCGCYDTNRLPLHMRLLHLIITHTITPRSGKHSIITQEDLWLMYRIVIRKPPSLSKIIISHMKSIMKRVDGAALPYGNLVTKILDSEVDDIAEEKSYPAGNKIGATTVGMIGFIKNESGQWIRKTERGSTSNRPQSPKGAEPESNFLSKVLQELHGLRKEVQKIREKMNISSPSSSSDD